MDRVSVIEQIKRHKIIAIIRGVEPDDCLKTARALHKGGIRLIEVTFDEADVSRTVDSIALISRAGLEELSVGAGTVTRPEMVELAAQAGAQYMISPDTNVNVIRRTRELGLVSLPGALTPTEILTAYEAGADFVKVFPAANLGPSYLKAIRAPISHVPLLVVGGIHEKNLTDYLDAGAVGAGIGGNLANREWIRDGQFEKITETARLLVDIADGHRR